MLPFWLEILCGIVLLYLGALIGSNSPQTFKRSKAGLERIANAAMAKARTVAQKGQK